MAVWVGRAFDVAGFGPALPNSSGKCFSTILRAFGAIMFCRKNFLIRFHEINDDQKLTPEQAQTLDEAQERAGRLRVELTRRKVHCEALEFCRAELLQENYFHAVFEATKSVAEKIRKRTGLTGDGADIVDKAFGISAPLLAINTLRTETEQSEQKGFANLIKGMFGTFRNVTGDAPKITWAISEQDALDLLSLVSYIHRRIDAAADVLQPGSASDS